MILYYRFEIIINEKPSGFLTALSELDDDSKILEEYLDFFDKYLKVPDFYYLKGKNKKRNAFAWFTEKGVDRFSTYISKIEKYCEEKGYSFIKREQPEVGTKRLLYKDNYQAIIKEK